MQLTKEKIDNLSQIQHADSLAKSAGKDAGKEGGK